MRRKMPSVLLIEGGEGVTEAAENMRVLGDRKIMMRNLIS